jgi:hypothetical protein
MARFILLTTTDNERVIVSTSIIAWVGKENNTQCWIRLKDGSAHYVDKSFHDMASILVYGEDC